MDKVVNKWAPGASYGPVLSQTDLYLLNTDLEINPILEGKVPSYQMQFHLVTGFSTSASRAPESDGSVMGKDEPATLPRISQMIIISRLSPWCTIIKRESGVTVADVCSSIYKDYTEQDITELEFKSLNPRSQDQLRRSAATNLQASQPQTQQWGYYTPAAQPDRLRRVDWLRERVYFEGLSREDNYTRQRLGYRAPNIFIMDLTS
ncbi:hypothetical protein BYT27DRAFT_6499238 [Phlegmacium glaucopus]|nr:hypothetical protein BYT27DRAFT_6499238 [Phlegmacium glaucopus]